MNTKSSPLTNTSSIQEASEFWYTNVYSPNVYADDVRSIIIYEIIPRIGSMHINEITHDHIIQFCQTALWEGISFSSIQFAITQLSSIYNFLVQEGLANDNPWFHPFVGSSGHQQKAVYTESEIIDILRLSQDSYYRIPLIMTLCLNISPIECLALSWDDVDYGNKCIHISKKLDQHNLISSTPIKSVIYSRLRKLSLPDIMIKCLESERKRQFHNQALNSKYMMYQFNPVFTQVNGNIMRTASLDSVFRSCAFMIGRPDLHIDGIKYNGNTVVLTPDICNVISDIITVPPYGKHTGRQYGRHRGELK